MRKSIILMLMAGLLTLVGCSDEEAPVSDSTSTSSSTTTTDNGSGTKSGTYATGTGKVTLQSSAFTVTTTAKGAGPLRETTSDTTTTTTDTTTTTTTTAVTDFKFCITKVALSNEKGNAVTDENGDPVSVEAVIGLVDVSDASATTVWDKLSIPVGFELSEIAVEVHKDAENCSGAEYSLSYNGTQLSKDLEFKFTFDPAITLGDGDVLGVALDSIAAAFQSAAAAGALSDEAVGDYVENLEGEATEEEDGDAAAKPAR